MIETQAQIDTPAAPSGLAKLVPDTLIGKKSKVYVTNNSGYPYEKAERFGELIFLTRGYMYYNKIDEVIKKLGNIIDEASEDDYLCLSGNNFICALAFHLWAKEHQICRVLHWDQDAKDYKQYNMAL